MHELILKYALYLKYNGLEKSIKVFLKKWGLCRIICNIWSILFQNNQINLFNKNQLNLVVFLVPPDNNNCGGIRMIHYFCTESREFSDIHNAELMVATFPNLFTHYINKSFGSKEYVFRFSQIPKYFKQLKNLEIIIPEYLASIFVSSLHTREIIFLKMIPKLRLSIFNQNPKLMPEPKEIESLYSLTKDVVCITDSIQDCRNRNCDRYSMPFHLIPILMEQTDYSLKRYNEKQNIVVLSPDKCTFEYGLNPTPKQCKMGLDTRNRIVDKLYNELPGFEYVTVENMLYSDYKKLISNAKYVITFGEGCDLYYTESSFSGSIAFSVYNQYFPSEYFKNLPTLFKNYDNMFENIVDRINYFENHPEQYDLLNKEVRLELLKVIGTGAFRKQIELYYRGELTTYPKLQMINNGIISKLD